MKKLFLFCSIVFISICHYAFAQDITIPDKTGETPHDLKFQSDSTNNEISRDFNIINSLDFAVKLDIRQGFGYGEAFSSKSTSFIIETDTHYKLSILFNPSQKKKEISVKYDIYNNTDVSQEVLGILRLNLVGQINVSPTPLPSPIPTATPLTSPTPTATPTLTPTITPSPTPTSTPTPIPMIYKISGHFAKPWYFYALLGFVTFLLLIVSIQSHRRGKKIKELYRISQDALKSSENTNQTKSYNSKDKEGSLSLEDFENLRIQVEEQKNEIQRIKKELINAQKLIKTKETTISVRQKELNDVRQDQKIIEKQLENIRANIIPFLQKYDIQEEEMESEQNPQKVERYIQTVDYRIEQKSKNIQYIHNFENLLQIMNDEMKTIYNSIRHQSPFRKAFYSILVGENENAGLQAAIQSMSQSPLEERERLLKILKLNETSELYNISKREFFDRFLRFSFLGTEDSAGILDDFMRLYLYRKVDFIKEEFVNDGIDVKKLDEIYKTISSYLWVDFGINLDASCINLFEDKFDNEKHEVKNIPVLRRLKPEWVSSKITDLEPGQIYDIYKIGISSKELGIVTKPKVVPHRRA